MPLWYILSKIAVLDTMEVKELRSGHKQTSMTSAPN